MALEATTLEYLWKVLDFGLIRRSTDKSVRFVKSIYDQGLDLPSSIDSALTDYITSADEAVLLNLALTLVQGFNFEPENQTRLVALLVERGRLNAERAFSFLSFEASDVDELSPAVRHVADAVWLLKQDAAEGRMNPDDDGLLLDALAAVNAERGQA